MHQTNKKTEEKLHKTALLIYKQKKNKSNTILKHATF